MLDMHPKKKRRLTCPPGLKVSILYELYPDTDFKFVSKTGPNNNPTFSMSVEVENKTFVGCGKTKKLAKHNAAEQAVKFLYPLSDGNPCDVTSTN